MNIFDPVLAPQNPALRPEESALLSMVQVPGPVMLAPVSVPQEMKKGPDTSCAPGGTEAS